jgi:Flp pilus assembly protein TadG
MFIRKRSLARDSRGQSLVETTLMIPLLLLLILNAVNVGYFFLITLNLTSAARNGIEYAIQGSSTPTNGSLPSATPSATSSTASTVSYLIYQEMTGALNAPGGVQVQVCSVNLGSTGSGSSATSNCQTCTNSGCTGGAMSSGSPVPDSDPESASGFALNRVDVTYKFNTLVPATPFNLIVASFPTCSSSGGAVSCTFVRHAEMRAMGS